MRYLGAAALSHRGAALGYATPGCEQGDGSPCPPGTKCATDDLKYGKYDSTGTCVPMSEAELALRNYAPLAIPVVAGLAGYKLAGVVGAAAGAIGSAPLWFMAALYLSPSGHG